MQRFRGGLVFKAHRRLYHSIPGLRASVQSHEAHTASEVPPTPETGNLEPYTPKHNPPTLHRKPETRNPEVPSLGFPVSSRPRGHESR